MKIMSWNMAHRPESWRHLLTTGADIALVQEASEPPEEIKPQIEIDSESWITFGGGNTRPWRAAIAKLTDNVRVKWYPPRALQESEPDDFTVSCPGTIAAAEIEQDGQEPITVFSLYGLWERSHGSVRGNWIYADASVHRLISDLSAFIGTQKGHRIIAAGDLNILHGYGEYGSPYWKKRYDTVFQRFDAIGLKYVGPMFPNGRMAEPWPDELPRDSRNVPTFRTSQQSAGSEARQLDFVFASPELCSNLEVRALNEVGRWGPSDHCMVEVVI